MPSDFSTFDFEIFEEIPITLPVTTRSELSLSSLGLIGGTAEKTVGGQTLIKAISAMLIFIINDSYIAGENNIYP